MSTRLFRVILPVSDIERAARFYEAVLDRTDRYPPLVRAVILRARPVRQ